MSRGSPDGQPTSLQQKCMQGKINRSVPCEDCGNYTKVRAESIKGRQENMYIYIYIYTLDSRVLEARIAIEFFNTSQNTAVSGESTRGRELINTIRAIAVTYYIQTNKVSIALSLLRFNSTQLHQSQPFLFPCRLQSNLWDFNKIAFGLPESVDFRAWAFLSYHPIIHGMVPQADSGAGPAPATPNNGSASAYPPPINEPDWNTVGVDGKIALIQKGTCTFGSKSKKAKAKARAAGVIWNNVNASVAAKPFSPRIFFVSKRALTYLYGI